MLVLSRKVGSSILIGNEVLLTVVKIDRNQVRLGIEAPLDMKILRRELVIDLPEDLQLMIDDKLAVACP
ncbi:MAG: carbon storage regulator [Planctomycetota bacterium]|nr:carbon storage regulator [Planctomycetota bacterium]RLS24949.1 MAG: carbon storage regulator [Planctomycetota bacterium]